MAEDDDVRLEVEAVQAFYGSDCRVIRDFPSHLAVHLRPRTADDSSQQFVEVILGINSSDQYPSLPPQTYIIDAKGLDESRQTHLISGVNNKASELSSCPMLLALCEEAVELLSSMNHPEGNCPLCLYPLVSEESTVSTSFMKLMSCYHCFHSECIVKWWKWLQESKEFKATEETSYANNETKGELKSVSWLPTAADLHGVKIGTCPVCRKVFEEKDIAHVCKYLESDLSYSEFSGIEGDAESLLRSEPEKNRRQRIEALLKLQHDNNGLIEPRKELAILPGVCLPESAMVPVPSASNISLSVTPTSAEGTSCQPCEGNEHAQEHAPEEEDSSSSANMTALSKRKTKVTRKDRKYNPRVQQSNRKQWIMKEVKSLDQ